jgi:hypothetical protein
MAQLGKRYYEVVARYVAESLASVETANLSIKYAMVELTNITTSNYQEGATAAEKADAAIDVTLSLLPALNNSYEGFSNVVASNSSLLVAVRAMNDYVMNNASDADRTAATTAGSDVLTEYINTIDWQYSGTGSAEDYSGTDLGTESGTPVQWIFLSKKAGYTVTDWDNYATAAAYYLNLGIDF